MLPNNGGNPVWRLVLPAALLALLCTTIFSLAYLVRQRGHIREIEAERDQMNAMLSQTRDQLQGLTQRLDALSAIQEQQAVSAAAAGQPAPSRNRRGSDLCRNDDQPRWMILETRLSDHQKQIAGTREELDKARSELAGRLDSTRDGLNGSIAKNHDELVELEKRGARSYYEFTLGPSKQFQRVGSIAVSLRKVNLKHKYYDLAMMVDDIKLDKKHVNLYEPVWINLADRPQPVQLVVNRIDKNRVHGYISEPRYKQSELAAAGAPAPKTQALQTR